MCVCVCVNTSAVCIQNVKGGVSRPVLNSYCWMFATMDIPPGFKG